jgi:hypothetical protein
MLTPFPSCPASQDPTVISMPRFLAFNTVECSPGSLIASGHTGLGRVCERDTEKPKRLAKKTLEKNWRY